MKTHLFCGLVAGFLLIFLAMQAGHSSDIGQQADHDQVKSAVLIYFPGLFDAYAKDLRHVSIPKPGFRLTAKAVNDILPISDRVIHVNRNLQDTSIDIHNHRVTKIIRHGDRTNENIELLVEKGTVTELHINGVKVPADSMDHYRDLIEQTLNELKQMKKSLLQTRTGLDDIDFEEIRRQMRAHLEKTNALHQQELARLKREMENFRLPEIDIITDPLITEIQESLQDIDVDIDELMKDIEIAVQKAIAACRDTDMKEIRREIEKTIQEIGSINTQTIREQMEKARREIEAIDHQAIQLQIEEALKEIELIDLEEINQKMQRAIEVIRETEYDLNTEKEGMDEMIRELEQLEIDDHL